MKISPVPVVVTLVPEPAKSVAPNVSVINAVPSTYQAYVSGHGEAKAHWA